MRLKDANDRETGRVQTSGAKVVGTLWIGTLLLVMFTRGQANRQWLTEFGVLAQHCATVSALAPNIQWVLLN